MTAENGSGPHEPPQGGPKGPIKDTMRAPLPKRFYKNVSVKDGVFFQVLLDERHVKTPKKRALMLPTRALADAVAAEWSEQAAEINPVLMPLTRFCNTAIDAVAETLDAVAADIVAFASSDMLLYRAETPQDLVRLQSAAWDPVIDWARETLRADFKVVTGVMPVVQSPSALYPVASALQPHEPFRLTALHVATTITGSALLALAMVMGRLSADEVWTAAHIDEDYQIAQWGEDEEAAARRAFRRREFDAAATLLAALKPV
jgi:chaperone required for assembly of F1-ATPase